MGKGLEGPKSHDTPTALPQALLTASSAGAAAISQLVKVAKPRPPALQSAHNHSDVDECLF